MQTSNKKKKTYFPYAGEQNLLKLNPRCIWIYFVCSTLIFFLAENISAVQNKGSSIKRAITPLATIEIENEYLEIAVSDNGHFTIGTSTGEPSRETDNNQPLLYGHPDPGTSDTMYKIDGVEYMLGASGIMTQTPVAGSDNISCTWLTSNIEIKQVLSFTAFTRTIADTVKIYYRIENKGTTSRTFALRIQFDTMLGSNDGAPFFVSGHGVTTTDTEFLNKNIDPDSDIPLQAHVFDSLSAPTVVSMMSLWGLGYRKPDRYVLGYWPVSRAEWDYTIVPDRSFLDNDGDGVIDGSSPDSDSSAIVWWGYPASNEITLAPGQTLELAVYYGISDLTYIPWNPFNIGITSPSILHYLTTGNYYLYEPTPFSVNLFLFNHTDTSVQGGVVKLNLPEEFSFYAGDTAVKNIGVPTGSSVVASSQTAQVSWSIQTFGRFVGNRRFSVTVQASGNEITVERHVYIPGITNAVYGRVTDNQNNPLIGASIAIYKDDILIDTITSQTDGVFVLENLSSGEYWLDISMTGYSPVRIPAIVDSNAFNALSVNPVMQAVTATSLPSLETYAFPNPVRERYVRISVQTQSSSKATIDIYTASGKKIISDEINTVTEGVAEYRWDIDNVVNGVYFYRVKAGSSSDWGKIAVIKYKR